MQIYPLRLVCSPFRSWAAVLEVYEVERCSRSVVVLERQRPPYQYMNWDWCMFESGRRRTLYGSRWTIVSVLLSPHFGHFQRLTSRSMDPLRITVSQLKQYCNTVELSLWLSCSPYQISPSKYLAGLIICTWIAELGSGFVVITAWPAKRHCGHFLQ